ncbi:hypothetical protein ACH5RR_024272 [Cinchona calisaya]|uniref:Uncharacterized protein n=1 Tax=Cinchona calisaya TaxID=153742 RepID=A0ABD2YZR3_9GENT
MKMSPVYPRNEAANCHGFEFDPQADFKQFLEEARKHSCERNLKAEPRHIEETRKAHQSNGEKKKRKLWKSSLFSWFKTDKKSKNLVEPLHGSTIPQLRRGIVSGPILQGSAGGLITGRPRKPTSGPLMSLFNPPKGKEDEIPYMCLSHLNTHDSHQSYGPVYSVT